MNKINFKTISFLLILATTINYIFFTNRFFHRENGFILGDWLVNYEGGFTRRGLFGEIILNLVNLLGLNVINFTFCLVIFVYLIFIYLFLKLINQRNLDLWLILLIFSPATFLFNFYDPLAIGRKEFLFFIFFLVYVFYRNERYSKFILPLFALCLTLTHELFVFLTPLLFLNRYIQTNSLKIVKYHIEIIITFLSLVALIFIIFFTNSDSSIACNYVQNFGLDEKVCWAINLTQGSKAVAGGYFKSLFYSFYYSIFILIIFLNIYFVLKSNYNLNTFKIFFGFVISFIPIFLLFFIVNDWGRYISTFTFICMILLIYNNKSYKKLKLTLKNIFIIILFATSWYMPHCCPERHFSNFPYKPGVYYVFERLNYRLNN